jgi:hypothetical protein
MRVKTSDFRCLTRDDVLVGALNFGDDPPCRFATVDGEEFDFFNGKSHRGGK